MSTTEELLKLLSSGSKDVSNLLSLLIGIPQQERKAFVESLGQIQRAFLLKSILKLKVKEIQTIIELVYLILDGMDKEERYPFLSELLKVRASVTAIHEPLFPIFEKMDDLEREKYVSSLLMSRWKRGINLIVPILEKMEKDKRKDYIKSILNSRSKSAGDTIFRDVEEAVKNNRIVEDLGVGVPSILSSSHCELNDLIIDTLNGYPNEQKKRLLPKLLVCRYENILKQVTAPFIEQLPIHEQIECISPLVILSNRSLSVAHDLLFFIYKGVCTSLYEGTLNLSTDNVLVQLKKLVATRKYGGVDHSGYLKEQLKLAKKETKRSNNTKEQKIEKKVSNPLLDIQNIEPEIFTPKEKPIIPPFFKVSQKPKLNFKHEQELRIANLNKVKTYFDGKEKFVISPLMPFKTEVDFYLKHNYSDNVKLNSINFHLQEELGFTFEKPYLAKEKDVIEIESNKSPVIAEVNDKENSDGGNIDSINYSFQEELRVPLEKSPLTKEKDVIEIESNKAPVGEEINGRENSDIETVAIDDYEEYMKNQPVNFIQSPEKNVKVREVKTADVLLEKNILIIEGDKDNDKSEKSILIIEDDENNNKLEKSILIIEDDEDNDKPEKSILIIEDDKDNDKSEKSILIIEDDEDTDRKEHKVFKPISKEISIQNTVLFDGYSTGLKDQDVIFNKPFQKNLELISNNPFTLYGPTNLNNNINKNGKRSSEKDLNPEDPGLRKGLKQDYKNKTF